MSDGSKFVVATSPFLKRQVDTPMIMRHVIYSLIPAVLASIYFFGLSALLVIVTCIAGCVVTEWLLSGRQSLHTSTVRDSAAIVTGLLLALTLPPALPLWMALLGSIIAIVFGKMLFGGLGQNVFNPSLVGRAFLQAAFPVAITTWSKFGNLGTFSVVPAGTFTLPFLTPKVDAITTATPLAMMKFESQPTAISDLLLGTTAGSIGETSALLILLGGGYLAFRKFLNWRIPAGIFASVYIVATVLHLVDPAKYPDGGFHLFSGGLVLGAVFMATDPVTSPVTQRGCWLFAAGVGALVVVIRQFSGLPEGVMYAILLMNGLTPLIDRYTQPRIYGAQKKMETR